MNISRFEKILQTNDILKNMVNLDRVAVAVSGGVDSMALMHLLGVWSQKNNGPEIFAISVDHGLRDESSDEVEMVAKYTKSLGKVVHYSLQWSGDKPDQGVMEAARGARYALISEFCSNNNIRYLCVAHHLDDQAETVVQRLISGSSYTGLSAMDVVSEYSEDLIVLRPLLGLAKEVLYGYAKQEIIPWVEDPTNLKSEYKRGKLRQVWGVLESEGLTSERLGRLAVRMRRVDGAMRYYADIEFRSCVIEQQSLQNATGGRKLWQQVVFDLQKMLLLPEEMRVRLVSMAMENVRLWQKMSPECGGDDGDDKEASLNPENKLVTPEHDYGVRLHRLEEELDRLWRMSEGKKVTLGRCLLEIKPGQGLFIIRSEK